MTSPATIESISRLGARVEAHADAIAELRKTQREDRDDVRSMRNLIVGTLIAALGGAIMQILAMMQRAAH